MQHPALGQALPSACLSKLLSRADAHGRVLGPLAFGKADIHSGRTPSSQQLWSKYRCCSASQMDDSINLAPRA